MLLVSIIGLLLIGFITGYLIKGDSGMCYYKIPNQLRFNCTSGNSSQIINSFQASLLEYKNSFSQDCQLVGDGSFDEKLDVFDEFHYEINDCGLDVPFLSLKL